MQENSPIADHRGPKATTTSGTGERPTGQLLNVLAASATKRSTGHIMLVFGGHVSGNKSSVARRNLDAPADDELVTSRDMNKLTLQEKQLLEECVICFVFLLKVGFHRKKYFLCLIFSAQII